MKNFFIISLITAAIQSCGKAPNTVDSQTKPKSANALSSDKYVLTSDILESTPGQTFRWNINLSPSSGDELSTSSKVLVWIDPATMPQGIVVGNTSMGISLGGSIPAPITGTFVAFGRSVTDCLSANRNSASCQNPQTPMAGDVRQTFSYKIAAAAAAATNSYDSSQNPYAQQQQGATVINKGNCGYGTPTSTGQIAGSAITGVLGAFTNPIGAIGGLIGGLFGGNSGQNQAVGC